MSSRSSSRSPRAISATSTTPTPLATASSSAAAPAASVDRCAIDDAKLAALRAKVRTLTPGMSQNDVNRALAVDLSCFAGGGQGGPDNFAVAYTIAPGVQLDLGWELRGDAGVVLRAAAITP